MAAVKVEIKVRYQTLLNFPVKVDIKFGKQSTETIHLNIISSCLPCPKKEASVFWQWSCVAWCASLHSQRYPLDEVLSNLQTPSLRQGLGSHAERNLPEVPPPMPLEGPEIGLFKLFCHINHNKHHNEI